MTAHIINGRSLQQRLVAPSLAAATAAGVRPRISLISVASEDPMLPINRELHLRTIALYGIECEEVTLPDDASLAVLIRVVEERNEDPDVHGIMVLMPLPAHISIRDVLPAISAEKELEGLHPAHAASLLSSNRQDPDAVLPLVGEAVLLILAEHGIPLENRNIVLLTEEPLMRNNPVANMVARYAAPAMLPPSSPLALVPIDHPEARKLAAAADVLIVSLERAEVVTSGWIKPGATVIDFNPTLIGFTTSDEGVASPILRGGVVTHDVAFVAGHLLPVPGGVGPVMLGLLMRNAAIAAVRSRESIPAA